MPQLSFDRTYDAPRAAVWAVVSDPDVYQRVAPNLDVVEVLEGTGGDTVRRCVDTDGNEWTEAATYWTDGEGFGMAVDVASSGFHRRFFSRFEGEWRLESTGDGTRVTVAFDYDTKYGPVGWLVSKVLASRAPSMVDEIFDGWATELRERAAGVA
ncbi:SRPBCC family protein [Halorubellus litoreus]|uniref:SRPBCC family protein n=1 Tax=Halorubellus litoreus TaxID=755308 RepID=A0ABD5VCA1_9EURY